MRSRSLISVRCLATSSERAALSAVLFSLVLLYTPAASLGGCPSSQRALSGGAHTLTHTLLLPKPVLFTRAHCFGLNRHIVTHAFREISECCILVLQQLQRPSCISGRMWLWIERALDCFWKGTARRFFVCLCCLLTGE